jgi:putative ABC transport system permease protein
MLWNDLRYALRLMRRSPGFTAVAVLSLALGIGANTAIYSLFYTIMLRPLPVPQPEELVELVLNSSQELHWAGYWGWEKYEYFRDRNHVFSGLTGTSFDNIASVRAEDAEPDTLILENVPGNYFRVLGLKPELGRLTGPEDVPASGEGDMVVVSWSYWNRRFHRDPKILGKRIWYNDAPKTVMGVAPRAYAGPRVGSRTDLWQPVEHNSLTMLARLQPGVTIAQAQAEIEVLYRTLSEPSSPQSKDSRGPQRMELLPAGVGLAHVRDQFGKPLVLLLAVVGLLLLLACINIAGMLLARSAGRQREIAVRVGLGASRGRLVRQMLTESVLLSGAGMLVGILLAYLFVASLVTIMASGRAFDHIDVEVQPDLHLLLVTTAVALLTGLLFGLAPAWYAFRSAPALAMRHGGSRRDTWFWRLFGKGLMTAQVALSIFLVTCAAVFLAHLARLRNFDLGFRSDHVLLMTLDLARGGYQREQLAAPYQQLLARLQSIPGVRSASISGCTPLQGCGSGGRYLFAEGRVEQPEDRQRTSVVFVAPRYFETLGIPLLAGRDFTFRDAAGPRVAIVNQTMARRYFPGVSPIGKHVRIDRDPRSGGWFGSDQPYQIVGLAGDAKAVELRDTPYPTMYFDMFQENRLLDQFELRTSGNPASMAATAQRMVRQVLPGVPREHNHHPCRPGGLEHRSRAPHRHFVRGFRRAGRGTRRHRTVRPARLHGGSPHPRNRNSDGARRDHRRHRPAGVRRRAGNGRRGFGGRQRHGTLGTAAGSQPDSGSAMGQHNPAGIRRRSDCGRGACGILCARAAGRSRRSGRGPTSRVDHFCPEIAALPVNQLVLLQIFLDGIERCQVGGAVREQIVFDATHALSGGENFLPRGVAFAEYRRVPVGVGRAIGKEQAVALAGILFDECHHVRAGTDGNVDISVERQAFRLGQNIDGAPDAVAPGLKLHRVVMEADRHAVPFDGRGRGLQHVGQLFPGIGFIGCLDGVIADFGPAASTTSAFLALAIGPARGARRVICTRRVTRNRWVIGTGSG